MAVSIGGLNPAIAAILQDNTLMKVFWDALFPALLYRMDAMPERWEANEGEVKVMTRTGLLPVDVDPLQPNTDPNPEQYAVEQWVAEAHQYGKAIDTHMPTSRAALASRLLRDVKTLGMNAGQTMNRLPRNALFEAYLGGNTVASAAAAIGVVQIPVASLNGFTDRLVNGVVTAVSAANPIPVEFGGAEPDRNVIAAVPDNPAAPLGPGTITVDGALTVGVAAREAVLADDRAVIFRVGGGDSVDAIGAADILTLDDIIGAVAILRTNDAPNHSDGFFHHHLSPLAEAQLFQDNHWQRLHDSLPESAAYRQFAIGEKVGCRHYRNTESPDNLNSGALVASGPNNAQCAPQIGGEVVNDAGIRIGRTIITGGSVLYECYIPESDYITEAGVTGNIGNFSVTNNGVTVETERIRYTMRAPLDRLQQVVGHAWSWSGDFAVPSDATTLQSRFGRAIIIEHALG
jgi:hypothetical protein